MSGCSSQATCPNCGKEANVYQDYKPFDYVDYTCLHCGLRIYPKVEYMELEELNSYRQDYEMEPLTELPEQDTSFY